jgi:hypothetical protein
MLAAIAERIAEEGMSVEKYIYGGGNTSKRSAVLCMTAECTTTMPMG